MIVCNFIIWGATSLLSLVHGFAERTPCSHDIALEQYGTCLLTEAEKYHPELKEADLDLKPLDLIPLGDFEVKTRDFVVESKNTVMKGLGPTQIVDVGWDLKQNTSYVILYSNTTLISEYTASGSILFVPMTSSGKLTVNTYNAKILITFDFRKVVDGNGIERLETYNFRTAQQCELMRFYLKTGNKIVDTILNAVLNYNWELLATVGFAKVSEIIANNMGNAVNKVFNFIPFDELINYV